MNSSATFAFIEYEKTEILIKVGDWVTEEPALPGNQAPLRNTTLIVIDDLFIYELYQNINKISSKLHKQVETQLRSIENNGEFQTFLSTSMAHYRLLKTGCRILHDETEFVRLREDILKILWELSDSGYESVVFAEILYDNPELVERYVELYFEVIETFAEYDQGVSIKLFTIFVNGKYKERFFKAIEYKFSKYSIFSYMQT